MAPSQAKPSVLLITFSSTNLPFFPHPLSSLVSTACPRICELTLHRRYDLWHMRQLCFYFLKCTGSPANEKQLVPWMRLCGRRAKTAIETPLTPCLEQQYKGRLGKRPSGSVSLTHTSAQQGEEGRRKIWFRQLQKSDQILTEPVLNWGKGWECEVSISLTQPTPRDPVCSVTMTDLSLHCCCLWKSLSTNTFDLHINLFICISITGCGPKTTHIFISSGLFLSWV